MRECSSKELIHYGDCQGLFSDHDDISLKECTSISHVKYVNQHVSHFYHVRFLYRRGVEGNDVEP